MTAPNQSFALELNGTEVRGTLHLPATKDNGQTTPCAVVLVCGDLDRDDNNGNGSFATDLRTTLVASGLAMAEIDTAPPGQLGATVNIAAAAMHALAVRDDIDLHRLGVLGYSLGAITVACLAGRSDQIARMALVAPVSGPWLAEQIQGQGAAAIAQRLGAPDEVDHFGDLDDLDPQTEIARHDRPTLILHGAADREVPATASQDYLDVIRAAGHSAEHMLVARGDHALADAAARGASVDAIARFFTAMNAKPAAPPTDGS